MSSGPYSFSLETRRIRKMDGVDPRLFIRRTIVFGNFTSGQFSDYSPDPLPVVGVGDVHPRLFYVAEPLVGESELYDIKKRDANDQKGSGLSESDQHGSDGSDKVEKVGVKRKISDSNLEKEDDIEKSLRNPVKLGHYEVEKKKKSSLKAKPKKTHKFKIE